MIEGVDISHHNGVIDWARVAAAGKRFAWCKATEGHSGPQAATGPSSSIDPTFLANMAQARVAGLYVGGYHFARPLGDAKAQANDLCQMLAPLFGRADLPPMLDLEEALAPGVPDQWLTLAVDSRIAWAATFVETVQQLIGRTCVIYTRHGWWRDVMGNSGALAACPVWAVQYLRPGQTRPPAPLVPDPWGSRWSIWQYSGSGSCDGFTGQVDLDVFNGDEAALAQLASGTVA